VWPDHFFLLFFVVAKKGLVTLPQDLPVMKSPDLVGVLIAGDELKRGVNNLGNYVNEL